MHERGERLDRPRVRPVHVVEADDQRGVGRDPLEMVAQLAMELVAVGPAVREPALQRLAPQRVRQVGLVLRRPGGEHAAPLGLLHQVPEQPRLADSGLSFEHQHAALAGPQRGQRAGDRLAFPLAPHQLP